MVKKHRNKEAGFTQDTLHCHDSKRNATTQSTSTLPKQIRISGAQPVKVVAAYCAAEL